jgi:hypothetical protein
MTIVEFLEARIAEDERDANDATGASWVVLPGVDVSMVNIDARLVRDDKWKFGRLGHIATTSHDAAYAEHIARWDPARVVAECAAKRAILDQHERAHRVCVTCEREFPCPTLEIMAAVYSDHPDYDEEWAL